MSHDPLDPPSRWIACAEQMPVDGDVVLVAIDADLSDPEAWELAVAWAIQGDWRTDGGVLRRVTHWQPLPEPPEK